MPTTRQPDDAMEAIWDLWTHTNTRWLHVSIRGKSPEGNASLALSWWWLRRYRLTAWIPIVLLLRPKDLRAKHQFMSTARARCRDDVQIIRIQAFDEKRCQRDRSYREYFEWLRAALVHTNLRWGCEEVHFIPSSACYKAGIVLTGNDTAFHDKQVVVSIYNPATGELEHRVFYEPGETGLVVDTARRHQEQLLELIGGGQYMLRPPRWPWLLPYPWRGE